MNKKNTSKDLLEFGALVNRSTDLNFILEKIIEEKSLNLLSTKRGTIYLLDEKGEFLIPKASIDPNFKDEAMSEPIPVKASLSGKVIKSRKSMIFNDTLQLPDAYKIPGTTDAEDENLMVVPLIFDKSTFGTINFYRDKIPFTDQELELANIFSMYASVAIQNALTNEQLNREIEERKNSERKYRNVIEHSTQMFYIHDNKNVLSYVSPQCFELFGYTPQEMMVNWTTLVTDNPINDEGFRITENTLKTGEISDPYILEIKRKDGQKRLVKVFESPLKNEKGIVVGISGSLEDVTKIKQNEEELIKKNEQLELFATIFENLNEGITVTDKNHKIFYVNNAFKKLYGYTEEEYIGKTADFLRADNDPEYLKKIKQATNNGGWSGEIINKKKDGTEFPIELSTTRIYDKEKNIIARIGIVRDITEKKKIGEELNAEREKYRALVENSTDAIYMVDIDGIVTFVNTFGAKMLGREAGSVIGKSVSKLFPIKLANSQKEFIQKVFETGKITRTESKIEFPTGKRWLENILIPVFNDEGKVTNTIGVSRDISEKKRYEMELEEHRSNLEKLVSERTEELEEKNKMLDSSVKVFVGREQTIIKLKSKIKELEAQIETAK